MILPHPQICRRQTIVISAVSTIRPGSGRIKDLGSVGDPYRRAPAHTLSLPKIALKSPEDVLGRVLL